MVRKLPAKDVVIVGLGWTGSIMAYELADAGLDVMAIERGPWRNTATDHPPGYAADELRYRIRHELFLRPEQTTFTFRNKMSQTALPIRTWAHSCRRTVLAAAACTGMRRPGASFPPISRCARISPNGMARAFCPAT